MIVPIGPGDTVALPVGKNLDQRTVQVDYFRISSPPRFVPPFFRLAHASEAASINGCLRCLKSAAIFGTSRNSLKEERPFPRPLQRVLDLPTTKKAEAKASELSGHIDFQPEGLAPSASHLLTCLE